MTAACPDCNAETELVQLVDCIFVLKILHDDTCPNLAARIRQETA